MTYEFKDAVRENVWLRMLLMGPTGAGKTRGALEVASHLFGGDLPIAGIDTEHGRMKLFADRYKFKHLELEGDHSPETWIAAMNDAAGQFTGGVLILDSVSHEWMGTNGILQAADKFGDWKTVRPRHNAWVEAILGLPMHVIACVRSKMKYGVTEYEDGGRTKQRIDKLGLGPIQDDTLPYEFDIVAAIDVSTHEATFSNRCDPLVDKTLPLDGQVAATLTHWLSEGEPPAPPDEAPSDAIMELLASLKEEGHSASVIEERFAAAKSQNRGVLHPDYVTEQLGKSRGRLQAKEKKEKAATPA